MSQVSFLALRMSPKLVLNRSIDAEGVRKPLDRHLECYHSALGAILGALGRILSAIRSPTEGRGPSKLATSGRPQPAGPYIRDSGDELPVQARSLIEIQNRAF